MAHAQLVEDQPVTTGDVLVLPTSFGEALLCALGQKTSVTDITRASQRIARYHEKFWKSRLILVPLQYRRHWILAAITNPHLARDVKMVKPPSQVTHRMHDRPDTNPFCIMVLNSLRKAWAVGPVIDLLKEFLRYIWSAIRGGVLEYFESYNVKCPQQLDGVSCGLYIVGFGEALMRGDVSERVRRSAQGIRSLTHSEYDDIFKPAELASLTFRQIKGSLLEQEASLHACVQRLYGHNAALSLLPTDPTMNPPFPVASNGQQEHNDATDDNSDSDVVLQGPVEKDAIFSTPSSSPISEAHREVDQMLSSPVYNGGDDSDVWGGIPSSDTDNTETEHSSSPSHPLSTSSQLRRRSPRAIPKILLQSTKKGQQSSPTSVTHDASVPQDDSLGRERSLSLSPNHDVPSQRPRSKVGGRSEAHDASGPQHHAASQVDPEYALPGVSGDGSQADIDAATVRNIFTARGDTPLCDDTGDFGQAVEAVEGYQGHSVRFYPDRDEVLQIPSGEITSEAFELRWSGISPEDVQTVRNYEHAMHLKMPQTCRDIIKGTIRANFDPEAHRWLACRIKVLSEFPERSTEKADYINSVVKEFFYRFADLHPSNMYLKDDVMERKYVEKIKTSLRSRASDLKTKQQEPSESIRKSVAAFIPFLDRILHSNTPTRPADLFFEAEGVRDVTKPLWEEHWAELKPRLIASEGSEEAANRYRISSYMAWRNSFFFDSNFVPKDVQDAFIKAAASQDKSQNLTSVEIFKRGLPLINNLLYEFSKRTGIPFMLAMTWVDQEHPGQVQTMLQTGRGQASTDISDFRHSGPFVDAELLPRWRSWAARVFELNDDVSHTMYEHVTPDEAAGCPEGTVPKIIGYSGEIDTSTEVKMARARTDLLKYIGERWCKANNRQRVNHDQMRLDINDKVPKSRLPKDIRQKEIERVMPDGSSVAETVDREVEILYTKFTTMPAEDFYVWLRHLGDPEIPPENQFFFSAELRRAEDAGATMPITVQAALERPPKPQEVVTPSSNTLHPSNNSQRATAPQKNRSKKKKDNHATAVPGSTSAKQKKQARAKSDDDEETEEAEEFVLPDSDESDDLCDDALLARPSTGSRKSKRLNRNKELKVQASLSGDETDRPIPIAIPNSHDERAAGSSIPPRDHDFLSGVSIMKPTRRLPGGFSLSPAVDPLDSLRVSQANTSLAMARSYLVNLPPSKFYCNDGQARISGPGTISDILTLMTMLDLMFPHRPQMDHPRVREETITREPLDPQLVAAVSAQVWKPLNNPKVAVPKAQAIQRVFAGNSEYVKDTFDTALVYAQEVFKVIRRRNLLSSEKEVYSATQAFSMLCRYVVFIGRDGRKARSTQNLVDVMYEWGTAVVTLTYAVHTTQATLLRYPHSGPGHPLTKSSVIPQLLLSFLTFLYECISDRQYAMVHVAAGDFLFLDLDKPPCFSLSNPNKRWFSAHPNTAIETRVYTFLLKRLESDKEAFENLSTIGQMELLTAVCALHDWGSKRMEEKDWISWMSYLNSCVLPKRVSDDGEDDETQQNSGEDDETQQNSARTQDVAEPPPASKERDPLANPPPNLASHQPTLSKTTLPKSSTPVSSSRASVMHPIDASASASTALSTQIGKMMSEPAEKAPSNTAPDHQTVSEGTDSLPSPTAQAPPGPDSVPCTSGFTSAGPSRWRPGDKAQLVMNKKLRDVEFVLQDGVLRMRDSDTQKLLNDRHKQPKDLPEFDRSLLYDRIPANAPQKLARFHLHSGNPPPPPDMNDPTTWEPFLPPDEEFNAGEVRSQWNKPPSRKSAEKRPATNDAKNAGKGPATNDGKRMQTRQTLAQKSKESEGVQLRTRSDGRVTNLKLSGGPKAS
ncbi:hypothetical protein FRC01_014616 [Tulasnella sp. 417]|nr:hypothetical protein FRC01_014616 [Tulasnella sp. 417]